MNIDRNIIAHYAEFYRRHTTHDVLGFWEQRTQDREFGGYIVPHDRFGRPFGYDKNIWCQSRQVYTFSEMYLKVDRDPRWLELAKWGRDFLVKHAYAGGGRWHYLLDRKGDVLSSAKSFFTNWNAMQGLCLYAQASGSREDVPLIEETLKLMESSWADPTFNEFFHFDLNPDYLWLSPRMVIASLGPVVRPVLGNARIDAFIDKAVHDILTIFAKDDQKIVYEVLDRNGNPMPGRPGQIVNPGHAIEATWFLMEEGLHRKDAAMLNRGATICDWMFEKGWDEEYGGIYGFCSPEGKQPPGAEQIAPWGERWDDKVWWVHSEALYATLLGAIARDDAAAFDRFQKLHDYTQRWFVDPEFGEWYEYLHRHGTPRSPLKGSWIKCAFHVPRNLVRVTHLLENPEKFRL